MTTTSTATFESDNLLEESAWRMAPTLKTAPGALGIPLRWWTVIGAVLCNLAFGKALAMLQMVVSNRFNAISQVQDTFGV